MNRSSIMWTFVAALSVFACGKKDAAPEPPSPAPGETKAARDPAPAPSGATAPVVAPEGEPAAATADESRPTDIGAYVPIVANPSMTSKLPCPPGTIQANGENVLECRSAGAVGKTLSKRQGPSIWFHKNGKVHRSGSYDRHEWTGRWWELDENGHPTSSSSYRDGKEDGMVVTFYANGKRKSETPYKEGKMNGTSKMWTEEGELMGLTVYADDKVQSTKTFKYKLQAASAAELKKMNEDLQKLLQEQKKEMEKAK